jgi:hypothetical protein
MKRISILASCIAFALLIGGTSGSLALTPVNCSGTPGALVAAFVPSGQFAISGTCVGNITISGNGTLIQSGGSPGTINGAVGIANGTVNVVLNGITIDGTGVFNAGITCGTGIAVNLVDVTIQNFIGGGIYCDNPGSIGVAGGLITGNQSSGVLVYNGVSLNLSNAEITGNGVGPPASFCSVCVGRGSTLVASNANIHDNANGPAISVVRATADLLGGTVQSPSGAVAPTIVVDSGKLGIANTTVTGPGSSNAIFATPGAAVELQGATVSHADAVDATILIADGSTLLSLGGNTIRNSASGGSAITIENASTFHQRNESMLGTLLTADTITGSGIVQVQSNMELGTGASTPSAWTGSISVQQNSSFRMDGGMTISGLVQLAQASNGFFNVANGGKNVVAGGVTCTGTAAGAASHIAGPANVVTSSGGSTSAVTIGTTPPACLGF